MDVGGRASAWAVRTPCWVPPKIQRPWRGCGAPARRRCCRGPGHEQQPPKPGAGAEEVVEPAAVPASPRHERLQGRQAAPPRVSRASGRPAPRNAPLLPAPVAGPVRRVVGGAPEAAPAGIALPRSPGSRQLLASPAPLAAAGIHQVPGQGFEAVRPPSRPGQPPRPPQKWRGGERGPNRPPSMPPSGPTELGLARKEREAASPPAAPCARAPAGSPLRCTQPPCRAEHAESGKEFGCRACPERSPCRPRSPRARTCTLPRSGIPPGC